MKEYLNWLQDEESGQGMVEYGLIIALVAIVVVGALLLLGPSITNLFNNVTNRLNNPSA